MSWLTSLEDALHERGLDPSIGDLLRAFASPVDPFATEVGTLEQLERSTGELPVAVTLLDEVDPAQAAMFERRYQAVLGLPGDDRWRVLRLGLHRRMAGILASPGPRATRVRAVVDFYFAQAAVLRWADPTLPEPGALPTTWTSVAPGVRHGHLSGHSSWGPVHVNLLTVHRARLETGNFAGRDFVDVVQSSGAAAGVSGGFFLYSEPDIALPSRRGDPVGLLVHDGRVLNPPWLARSALVQHTDGTMQLQVVAPRGRRWTRAHGTHSPANAGPVVAVVGHQIVARGEGRLAIPLAGAVLACPADQQPTWVPGTIHSAVAGGPMLFSEHGTGLDLVAEEFAGTAPPITFSQDETFDQNLLPRMGVGLRDDGSVLFCAVDGRNFDRAPGMTLRQLAATLRAHGCVRAMNLDGGSSKRMVVGGRIVDLPSTEVQAGGKAGPVRPVRSGILIHAAD